MPSQYGYPNYSSSSYPSGYLPSLSEEDKTRDTLDVPSTYPGSYAPTPALASSPAHPTRAPSLEPDAVSDKYTYPTSYPFPPAASSAPTFGYHAPHAPLPNLADLVSYPGAQPNTYGVTSYGPHPGYGSSHGSSYHHSDTINPAATQADAMRMVDGPKESRCWDHGCNGRAFSTHSNLLRHVREKSGQATKSTCPRCGAVFTRKTAMNGHMQHDKCKRKSGYDSERSASAGADER
jgi:hypothetical protein